jgi:hypothetical protein
MPGRGRDRAARLQQVHRVTQVIGQEIGHVAGETFPDDHP